MCLSFTFTSLKRRKHILAKLCICITKNKQPNNVFLISFKNGFFCQHNSVPKCYMILYSSPSAYLLQLSGRKTVGACQREVSLVLSISSGVDKKTDGTAEVRGPCYSWRVCLFGLSLISCFPLSSRCADSAYSLTWKWPRQDGSRPLFSRRVNINCPARYSEQLKTHGASEGFWPLSCRGKFKWKQTFLMKWK